MRKELLGAAGVLLSALWAGSALAMYTPNPAGRWAPQRFFLAGDFQFNDKDLDPDGKITDMTGFFARPTYSIVRDVTVYGMLGFQQAHDLDTGFAGGFGVQGAYVFPRAREWAIGGSFQYLHWASDTHTKCIERDRFGTCIEEAGGRSIDWNEFQLSPAVSYRIPAAPAVTPYGGLLLDFVDARDSVSERDPVGLLFGVDIDAGARVRLGAQFRVISETGFAFSAGYLF